MSASLKFPLAGKPPGFLVWNPDRSPPTYVHETFASALAEAERLKRMFPRERFFVMAPMVDEHAVTYGSAFDLGRRAGLDKAHDVIMAAEANADLAGDRVSALSAKLRPLQKIADKARDFQAIVADALCWFDGFAAAHAPKDSWERPHLPDRDRLRALNSALQAIAYPPEADSLDSDVPF